MKVKLNPMFEQVRGQLGEMVFRELRGETIASRKPTFTGEPSVDQLEHRERFKQAAAYGKSALANPVTRELYEAAADSKNIPVFAVTVADFFNAPVIDSVELAAYTGQVGDLITISARDDFEVVSVHVSISETGGSLIESGNAVYGDGQWVFTATDSLSSGTSLEIRVVATDRPGGTTVANLSKTL